MENRRIKFIFILLGSLLLASSQLQAQSTVQEMIDKGKSLMIEKKYSDALTQFKNAIVIDSRVQDSIQKYIDICIINVSPRPVPKLDPVKKFTISTDMLDFTGYGEEQTIKVTLNAGDWEAESLEDWCKITVNKAFKEVTVFCDENFSGVSRKCLISFTYNDGHDNVTKMFVAVRQKTELEVLKVKDGYFWRNQIPDFLKLESTGDLVIVNLDCNTEWTVLHKPKDVEVGSDNGDMTKLVIRIAQKEIAAGAVKLANKFLGALEKDYITIATVNQDVRLTIQTERYILGKSQEEREAKKMNSNNDKKPIKLFGRAKNPGSEPGQQATPDTINHQN